MSKKRKRAEEDEVDWSNLPAELIAKRFIATATAVDIHRFRSTCTLWRSAAPLPPPSSRIVFPPPQMLMRVPPSDLLQTRIYRLQLLSPPPRGYSSNKGWIIKVGRIDDKYVSSLFPSNRLLNPFTDDHLSSAAADDCPQKLLNVAKFRFSVLVEAYSYSHFRNWCVRVLFPSGPMAFGLRYDGALLVSKIDDEGGGGGGWTVMGDRIPRFHDVIVRAGQLYALHKSGPTVLMRVDSSSLELVSYSSELDAGGGGNGGGGEKKQLVECGGSLYLVDLYIKWDEVVDVRVYRLDEESGRWCEVNDLGGAAFVLGMDSNFSLSPARDYYGCTGNCVFFYDAIYYDQARIRAFSLRTSKFKSPKQIKPFWPCPSLFHPKFH